MAFKLGFLIWKCLRMFGKCVRRGVVRRRGNDPGPLWLLCYVQHRGRQEWRPDRRIRLILPFHQGAEKKIVTWNSDYVPIIQTHLHSLSTFTNVRLNCQNRWVFRKIIILVFGLVFVILEMIYLWLLLFKSAVS